MTFIPQYRHRQRAFAEGGGVPASGPLRPPEPPEPKSLGSVIKRRRAKRARENAWKGKRGKDFTRDAIQSRYDAKS